MIEIRECPVCNGREITTQLTCVDHSVSHETFSLAKCPTCELLITTPRPASHELDGYYLSPSYTSHISKSKNLWDKIYLATRRVTLKWKLNLIKKHTSFPSSGRLLDFGCGTGEFLRAAKQQGWQTTGMEPSNFARSQADPEIATDIKASLEEIIYANQTYDAITLWHVLEHIEDLNSTISKLKGILTETGTIFIAVPNHRCKDAHIYQQYWAGYDVPRHLWHFSKKNMKILAEHHGLSITEIIPMRLDAYYVSILSEKYRNSGHFTIGGIITAAINAFKSNFAARTNMEYSSLIYILKK